MRFARVYIVFLFLFGFTIIEAQEVDSTIINKGISFFEPVYNVNNKSSYKSFRKTYKNNTDKTLDSLFLVEFEKYRIIEKFKYTNDKGIKDVENDLIKIIKMSRKIKKLKEIKIPLRIKSLLKRANSEYVLIIAFDPLIRRRFEFPTIKTLNMEIVVIDVQSLEVSFYKKMASDPYNIGFRQALINNLDNFYLSFFRAVNF